MLLLEEALAARKYDYYHLLSGEDLPIQNMSDIHAFFERNAGKEFICFESDNFTACDRVKYWWMLQEIMGRNGNWALAKINNMLLKIQKLLRVSRNRGINFQKGSNWFSITEEFARYVVDARKFIKKKYKYTICCDEIFLQTLCINSKFKDRLYCKELKHNNVAYMRLIDWDRGRPYVFKADDFEMIKQSDMLFARKFQCEVDSNIIKMIEHEYS